MRDKFGEDTFCDSKSSAEGMVAFENKLIAKGDMVYVYAKKPQKETGVISITVTKNEESSGVARKSSGVRKRSIFCVLWYFCAYL